VVKIGVVRIDIEKHEYQYRYANFGDVNCIKALIQNRWQLDSFYDSHLNFDYNTAGDVYPFNVELCVTFWDLDRLIDQNPFLVSEEKDFVKNIMQIGWFYDLQEKLLLQEITDDEYYESLIWDYGTDDVEYLEQELNIICDKIYEYNLILWKENYCLSIR
jgi:hypothetical protein